MRLSEAWEAIAETWAAYARTGEDSYFQSNARSFLELLPAPGRLTVDIGCGEGRLTRDLRALSHRVIGFGASPTFVRLAGEADPAIEFRVADAAGLPLEDGASDLALAFMSLQDMDDMAGAVREASRVLEPRGRFSAWTLLLRNRAPHQLGGQLRRRRRREHGGWRRIPLFLYLRAVRRA